MLKTAVRIAAPTGRFSSLSTVRRSADAQVDAVFSHCHSSKRLTSYWRSVTVAYEPTGTRLGPMRWCSAPLLVQIVDMRTDQRVSV